MPTVSQAASLQDAITDFKKSLASDQRERLEEIKSVPDAAAILLFTAELDRVNASRRGRSIASRLLPFFQSVQQFVAIVDTFVSANPNIAALVWGSVRVTMLVAVNFLSYFEKLSAFFLKINDLYPRFAEYQVLFPKSERLQMALCSFHAALIRCCKQAVHFSVTQRSWPVQVVESLWRSFDHDFQPFQAEIQLCSETVEKEILLAKAQADHAAQRSQSKHRNVVADALQIVNRQVDGFQEWRIQRDALGAKRYRQKTLKAFCSYDHASALKQARRKRHHGTAQWLLQTPQFTEWCKSGPGISAFLCSGKLGSGKTILASSVIDHLLCNHQPAKNLTRMTCVSYFFVRFDEPSSLLAETILKSIIKQCLDCLLSSPLPTRIHNLLEKFINDRAASIDELKSLIQDVAGEFGVVYIILDGLDECEKTERNILLEALASVHPSLTESSIRAFFSCRSSMIDEIHRFSPIQHVQMNSSQASTDISLYTREVLEWKIQNGDLVIGDDSLIEQIQNALVAGAQGMFLWVAYEIEEICAQHTDDEIRQALENLPRDLAELFERALNRIRARGHEPLVSKVFGWIAAAKRPFTWNELREGISIKTGQTHYISSQMINGTPTRVISWCENLVDFDEETTVLQFSHHTVLQFLLSRLIPAEPVGFNIDLNMMSYAIGCACVTVLNFPSSKNQVVHVPSSSTTPNGNSITLSSIIDTTLKSSSVSKPLAALATSVIGGKSSKSRPVDAYMSLANYRDMFYRSQLQDSSFLDYALEYWPFHTQDFKAEDSTPWDLWTKLLQESSNFAKTPWSYVDFIKRTHGVEAWVLLECHFALFSIFSAAGSRISSLMFRAILNDKSHIMHRWLHSGILPSSEGTDLLQAAVRSGDIRLVEQILTSPVDFGINDGAGGETALECAAWHGHVEIVKALLSAGANPDIGDPLFKAISYGDSEIVDLLIKSGALVNAKTDLPHLIQASIKGKLAIVKRLLDAGADVDKANLMGNAALHEAVMDTNLEVVKELLNARASPYVKDKDGFTPRELAIRLRDNTKGDNAKGRLTSKTKSSDKLRSIIIEPMLDELNSIITILSLAERGIYNRKNALDVLAS